MATIDQQAGRSAHFSPITELSIANLKCFSAPQTIPMAPLTLVYGPNSAGKSTVLQALTLLADAIDHRDGDVLHPHRSRIDLGGLRALVHDHDPQKVITLGVASESAAIEYRIGLSFSDSGDSTWLAGVRARGPETDGGTIGLIREGPPPDTSQYDADYIGYVFEDPASIVAWRDLLVAGLRDSGKTAGRLDALEGYTDPTFRDFLEHPSTLQSLDRARLGDLRVYLYLGCLSDDHPSIPSSIIEGAPAPFAEYARDLVELHGIDGPTRGFFSRVSEQLLTDRLAYLGPLRAPPARYYTPRVSARGDGPSSGENVPHLIRDGGEVFCRTLNEWLKVLEIPYKIDVRSVDDEVMGTLSALRLQLIRAQASQAEESSSRPVVVSPADVGVGIGQVLPILVEGLTSRNKIICVEQPEVHLHPRLQAQLAEFLVATACTKRSRDDSYRNQWVIETHSELLILRIQKLIRTGKLSPEDVSVVYVHPGNGDGAQVLPLRLDEEGRFIDSWPSGFFEDGLNEFLT